MPDEPKGPKLVTDREPENQAAPSDDRGWRWVLLLRGGADFMCQIKVENLEKLPESFLARKPMDVMDFPDGKNGVQQKIVPMASMKKLCMGEGYIYRSQVAQIWPLQTEIANICQRTWDKVEQMEQEARRKVKPFTEQQAKAITEERPATPEEEKRAMDALASMMARGRMGFGG